MRMRTSERASEQKLVTDDSLNLDSCDDVITLRKRMWRCEGGGCGDVVGRVRELIQMAKTAAVIKLTLLDIQHINSTIKCQFNFYRSYAFGGVWAVCAHEKKIIPTTYSFWFDSVE